MIVSVKKSSFYQYKLDKGTLESITSILPYNTFELEDGFKYLVCFLKPNSDKVQDSLRMFENFEKQIKQWTFRFLSIGGRLTLIKGMLISIHVY